MTALLEPKGEYFGIRKYIPRLSARKRVLILLACLVLTSTIFFTRSRAASYVRLADLAPLSLEEIQRIVVIAPHPDDETLAAAGLMQVARELGIDVKVVIITNGDGQRFAPLAINGRIRPGYNDFIAMGERRQVEALAALEQVGIPAKDVYFLGYPDRSLNSLWVADWKASCPHRSAYTRASYNPYELSYTPGASYCGTDLLKDLQELLEDFKADFIVLPHPNDGHPDHRAAANFTRLAVAMYGAADPDYQPQLWTYLTHYGSFPQPRGNRPAAHLLPPIPLSGEQNRWARLDLTPAQVLNKVTAIGQYPTQVRLLGNFLPSFARSNEIFQELPIEDLSPIGFSSIPLHENGVREYPALAEPSNEGARQVLLGGADIEGWRVTRIGNTLFLTAHTRGQLVPGLHYRILVKSSDGSTRVFTANSPEMSMKRTSFSAQIDLEDFDDASIISFSADVRQRMVLDHTGWYFLVLRDWFE